MQLDWWPLSKENDNKWTSATDDPLWLLTPEELKNIPEGFVLTSIHGEKKTVGIDDIPNDTRFGMLAYGVLDSQLLATDFEGTPGVDFG